MRWALLGSILHAATASVAPAGETKPVADHAAAKRAQYVRIVTGYFDKWEKWKQGQGERPSSVDTVIRTDEVLLAEYVRLMEERRGLPKEVLEELLSISTAPDIWPGAPLTKLAVRSLEAAAPDVRQHAVYWCIRRKADVPGSAYQRACVVARELLKSTRGRMCLYEVEQTATPDDVPLIRSVYGSTYQDREDRITTDRGDMRTRYNCFWRWNSYPNRSRFLFLLARLGEAKALAEIRDAIQQDDDPQQRGWGIHMAGLLKDPSFIPGISQTLTDLRICPQATGGGVDPTRRRGAGTHMFRRRVCDIGLQALHHILSPAKPWPVAMPKRFVWEQRHGDPGMDMMKKVGFVDSLMLPMALIWVCGFTDEQLDFGRDVADRLEKERIAAMRAGRFPAVRCCGAGTAREVLEPLMVAYVTRRGLAHLSHSTGTQATAVGQLLAGREVLLLDSRVTATHPALRLHGDKWKALKPAEHLLAARGVAVVVNSANKVKGLTLEQVQAVFGGKVKDWAILGLAAGNVHTYAPGMTDAASKLFHAKVLSSYKCGGLRRREGSKAVLQAVTTDPHAIAFVNALDVPAGDKSIRIVPILVDGKPTSPLLGAVSGAYPISERLWLYVNPTASATAKDFAQFIVSGACRETFQAHGLLGRPFPQPPAPKAKPNPPPAAKKPGNSGEFRGQEFREFRGHHTKLLTCRAALVRVCPCQGQRESWCRGFRITLLSVATGVCRRFSAMRTTRRISRCWASGAASSTLVSGPTA